MRTELAAIAADMIALTALKDENTEDLKATLSASLSEDETEGQPSLAERAVGAIERVSLTKADS